MLLNKFATEKSSFAVKSIKNIVVRVLAAFTSFLVNLLIAKLVSPAELGSFFIVLSLIMTLSQVATLGLGNAIIRYLGVDKAENNWKHLNSSFSNILYICTLVSFGCSLLLYLCSNYIAINFFAKEELSVLIVYGCLSIPPVTVLTVFVCAFQGISKPMNGIFFQTILQASLFGCLVYFLASDARDTLICYFYSQIISLLCCSFFWYQNQQMYLTSLNYGIFCEIKKDVSPLFIVLLLNLILSQSPILLGGVYLESDDIAKVSIYHRLATLTNFILIAVNMVVAPMYSALYSARKIDEISVLAKKSMMFMVLICIPISLFLILYINNILLLFGEFYVEGSSSLIILILAQMVSVLFGSVSLILVMSGYANKLNVGLLYSVLFTLFSIPLLVPLYGLTGLVSIMAIALIMQGIISSIYVKRLIGIKLWL